MLLNIRSKQSIRIPSTLFFQKDMSKKIEEQTRSRSEVTKIGISREVQRIPFPWSISFTFFDVGHMLNPPVSNVPPWKDFFLDHPFGLQVPKRGAPKPSEGFGAIFSPFFPSHRRTLWDRNFSLEYVKSPCLKFPPLKGFFFGPPVRPTGPKRCCSNPLHLRLQKCHAYLILSHR